MYVLIGYIVNNLYKTPSVSNAVGYTLYDFTNKRIVRLRREQVESNCNQIKGLAKSRRGITLSNGFKSQGLQISTITGQVLRRNSIIVLGRGVSIVQGRRFFQFVILKPDLTITVVSADELVYLSRFNLLCNAQIIRNSTCPISCYKDCCINVTPQYGTTSFPRPRYRRSKYRR